MDVKIKENKKYKVRVPIYSLEEELLNSISHGIGGVLAIAFLVLAIIISAKHKSAIGIIVSCIYGISMFVMYLISCLYHALSSKTKAKKVFRVLDHCDIYVFIAGCYTPYCLIAIGGIRGIILFSVVWLCAIIGILLNSINLEKFKVISLILYFIMGWAAIFSINTLINTIELTGVILLIAGGVVYSLGALFYMLGRKIKYFHSIFHIFILCASVLQFLSIYGYVL